MSWTVDHLWSILVAVHWIMVVGITVRVITRRPATGVALAWLLLISIVPYAGATVYLLVGERRIGERRARMIARLRTDYRQLSRDAIQAGLTDVDYSRHDRSVRAMNELGRNLVGVPAVCGCELELMSDTQEILKAIAADVDAARASLLMEFYIWESGGTADDVLEAVIRAAQRGVVCCVLIDALGARPWWKTDQPQRLRDAGVKLLEALPVGLFRTFIGRTDLRLHRKVVVVDSRIAWTGSMNLVDPRYFKKEAGVGQWVDAMVRLRGSVVVPLALTMISDWALESDEGPLQIIERTELQLTPPQGNADVQVIPSGPSESGDAQLQMILTLINSSYEEIVLTTPYFVPDESLMRAVRGAAARGVSVRLVVPERVDSFLTRHASRSYFEDLLAVGVKIFLFRGGLLHTKSITVDGRASMFGTVNLDMRSIWLNYEVALYVYDVEFTARLRSLQETYMKDSDQLSEDAWASRPLTQQFLDDTMRLMSPLL